MCGRKLAVLLTSLVLAGALLPAGATVLAVDGPTYYLHGTATDQLDKAAARPGPATFDSTPPTEAVPDTQTTLVVAADDFPANALAAYWRGPFSGTIAGQDLELRWYWSTPNAEATVLGAQVTITVFADPDYVAGAQPQRIIGRAVVRMPDITAAPTLVTSRVPLGGTVTSELLIQVVPDFVDTGEGLLVHYDSTLTPSAFRVVDRPPTPEVVHDTSASLAFAPSTIVSPTFLGAEPMTFMERPVPRSEPGAVDPNRIFVDWPLSTRSQVGQLSRSLDGGDSFRLLYDPTCAPRSRPMCLTGGGGDTESEVNLVTGTVLFSDQEGVANEAVASSVDHGDTFPVERQFALTNATTATDRQWLAWSDPAHTAVAGRRIEGFLAYHLPAAGQYIQGIDEGGVVIPQPVPQIALVSQSGPLRVDNTDGPGSGWIYQSYRDSSGYKVGVAPVADWQDPTAWSTSAVSSDQPAIFPWLALDSRGNAYAVWVTGGIVYLSVSNIDDPRNDPSAPGGRPGSSWTAKVRITPPSIRSAVFPVVTAGDAGRTAIAYMGSEDCLGANGQPVPGPVVSDNCGVASHWRTYTAVLDDALALHRGTPARVVTGEVSHRVVHRGSVCTSGTTCTGDRSLLDMIDVGVDAAGRVGVVFMDNNNRLATPNETDNAKNGPFVQFAKQVAGPSLLAEGGDHAIAIPENSRDDVAGDATWPNRAGMPNLGALDIRDAAIGIDGEDLVVRLRVGDTSAGAAAAALERVNAVRGTDVPADRLQHVVRFSTGFDIWHLSLETLADGTRRAFGGRLDANDGQVNPTSPTALLAAGYHTDALPVTAGVGGGIVTLRARAADLGLALGDRLTSVSAFAMAGPAESISLTAATPMRTVDANPPFDATLAELAVEDTAIDCADERVIRSGGWAVLEDARAGEGTLCRANVKSDGGAPTIDLRFDGEAVDVVVATGPRGGQLDVSVDDGSPTRVDLYRASGDPDKPDNSGRKDLTFGVAVRVAATGGGPHTLRVRGLPGSEAKRDMVYVDGFVVVGGEPLEPVPGGTQDTSVARSGELAAAARSTFELVADAATAAITVVVEAAPDVTVTVLDPVAGEPLAVADARDGLAVLTVTPTQPATYTLVISNPVATSQAYTVWTVHGRYR